jgi:ubiquinone/menaquinone biosynthesis C-methylase UbiE
MDFDKKNSVVGHYGGSEELETRLEELLRNATFSRGSFSPNDIAGLDQFHVGGISATAELAELLAISSKSRVLDVGSGLGGPSRYLAYRFGCHVSGVDLSDSYCRAAKMIARLMNLEDEVSYYTADARALPFENETFDIVWTQHASMNIEDKSGLYREVARVLKRGGYLALYDIVQSKGGPLHFPVPWAREPGLSHLRTPEEMLQVLTQSGFESHIWEDVSSVALNWLKTRSLDPVPPEKAALSQRTVMGDDFPIMISNFRQNLEEDRCGVLQAVLQRCDQTGGCR